MALKKQQRLLIGNAVFFLVAAIYLVLSGQINVINVFGVTVVDSTTIPRVLGVMLLVLNAISLCQNLGEYKRIKNRQDKPAEAVQETTQKAEDGQLDVEKELAEAEENEANAEVDKVSVILSIVCMALFAALINPLGFLLASFVYMVLQALVLTLKEERKKKFGFILVLSAVFAVAVYMIFTKGLGLMLPTGILG
jgi:putative tricarboxylic transport membrane protein